MVVSAECESNAELAKAKIKPPNAILANHLLDSTNVWIQPVPALANNLLVWWGSSNLYLPIGTRPSSNSKIGSRDNLLLTSVFLGEPTPIHLLFCRLLGRRVLQILLKFRKLNIAELRDLYHGELVIPPGKLAIK